MKREFSLPDWLESAISMTLKNWNLGVQDSKRIAEAILKMSDFYLAHPEDATPWKETWCQIAQVAYYLPLNFLRSQSVLQEAQARNFPLGEGELLDFGSGLGAGSLPWLAGFQGPFVFVERSAEAQKLHQKILQSRNFPQRFHWISEREIRQQKNRTALFSYSLTELSKVPDWVKESESLIWIEPSTREDGRKLLEKRKDLLAHGFSMWAPCPHQEGCPLLEDSKTDWCHDRIHLKMPDWFLDIEKHLPMKNSTLTFTYLLASKKPSPMLGKWRMVGDQLEEKGKTRQLLCRNSKRQFLTWMHRNGPVPDVPRGVLVDVPESFEERANEVRVLS
ncbi:MAG: small ribosomal subunit Rsm22 family protein [Pseudobdellovibrionaceae bacterium]